MSAGPGSQRTDVRIPAWTRSDFTTLADRMLAAVVPYASPNHARITLPGGMGGYGQEVDGLEGFARTFLLAGFRIAGERGTGVDNLIDFYSRGITAGVDPTSPERWVRPTEHAQAKVEAASLALVLDMTRPWIWDNLTATTQSQLIDYLAPIVGDQTYPKTNWLWFRVVVETFLRSVGGPWSATDITEDLALHDSLYRTDGWYSDGVEQNYDHYIGWAMHLYPILWARMTGAGELADGRTPGDVARLDRYLLDAVRTVGADGAPLFQGRSLIYRFAAAAPFWVGALAEVPSTPLGQLRRAATGIIHHFTEHGAPDERGLLTMGWHGTWRRLAQSYSGPGSPYWATKGLLGVALPADHPVWSAPDVSLPSETGTDPFTVRAAGWAVAVSGGIVRIANHGADHATPGTQTGDSPIYARIGYSTATTPLLDGEAWIEPVEQSAALVDGRGRTTHRTAIEPLNTDVADGLALAASRSRVHLLDATPSATQHGSGLAGTPTGIATVTTVSVLHGAWELRLVKVSDPAPDVDLAQWQLRIGGWPVTGTAESDATAESVTVTSQTLTSTLTLLTPAGATTVVTRPDASPLGSPSTVPVVHLPVAVDTWVAALIGLQPSESSLPDRCQVVIAAHGDGTTADVTWPDQLRTTVNLSALEFGHAV